MSKLLLQSTLSLLVLFTLLHRHHLSVRDHRHRGAVLRALPPAAR